jgi:hypothetical protein
MDVVFSSLVFLPRKQVLPVDTCYFLPVVLMGGFVFGETIP